ncbi:hypothetical protein H5410_064818, partial [Solanum commersonii]
MVFTGGGHLVSHGSGPHSHGFTEGGHLVSGGHHVPYGSGPHSHGSNSPNGVAMFLFRENEFPFQHDLESIESPACTSPDMFAYDDHTITIDRLELSSEASELPSAAFELPIPLAPHSPPNTFEAQLKRSTRSSKPP